MSTELDIDDVCAGHPVALAELERLREVERVAGDDGRGYSQQTMDAVTRERDALRADRIHRLLRLASGASMDWGRRDRAGWTLTLQFESGREAANPDDLRRAIDAMPCDHLYRVTEPDKGACIYCGQRP